MKYKKKTLQKSLSKFVITQMFLLSKRRFSVPWLLGQWEEFGHRVSVCSLINIRLSQSDPDIMAGDRLINPHAELLQQHLLLITYKGTSADEQVPLQPNKIC